MASVFLCLSPLTYELVSVLGKKKKRELTMDLQGTANAQGGLKTSMDEGFKQQLPRLPRQHRTRTPKSHIYDSP